MPAPSEIVSLNQFVKMVLQGTINEDKRGSTRDVLIRPDRSLVLWSRLVGHDAASDRERVALLDAAAMLRMRPYEPIFPVTPRLMPSSLATAFTSTAARTEVWLDVANSANSASATCHVTHLVAASGDEFDWYPSATPVRTGVPIRTGFIQLESGDSIRVSSSPGDSCTVHVHVHRYNPTGDTP